MPRLSELLKNQVTLVVPYRGTEISITYKPESVTSARRAEIQKRIENGEITRDQYDAAFLAATLTQWDLLAEDDSPLAISFPACASLSTSMQMAMAGAILDDQQNPQIGHTPASN